MNDENCFDENQYNQVLSQSGIYERKLLNNITKIEEVVTQSDNQIVILQNLIDQLSYQEEIYNKYQLIQQQIQSKIIETQQKSKINVQAKQFIDDYINSFVIPEEKLQELQQCDIFTQQFNNLQPLLTDIINHEKFQILYIKFQQNFIIVDQNNQQDQIIDLNIFTKQLNQSQQNKQIEPQNKVNRLFIIITNIIQSIEKYFIDLLTQKNKKLQINELLSNENQILFDLIYIFQKQLNLENSKFEQSFVAFLVQKQGEVIKYINKFIKYSYGNSYNINLVQQQNDMSDCNLFMPPIICKTQQIIINKDEKYIYEKEVIDVIKQQFSYQQIVDNEKSIIEELETDIKKIDIKLDQLIKEEAVKMTEIQNKQLIKQQVKDLQKELNQKQKEIKEKTKTKDGIRKQISDTLQSYKYYKQILCKSNIEFFYQLQNEFEFSDEQLYELYINSVFFNHKHNNRHIFPETVDYHELKKFQQYQQKNVKVTYNNFQYLTYAEHVLVHIYQYTYQFFQQVLLMQTKCFENKHIMDKIPIYDVIDQANKVLIKAFDFVGCVNFSNNSRQAILTLKNDQTLIQKFDTAHKMSNFKVATMFKQMIYNITCISIPQFELIFDQFISSGVQRYFDLNYTNEIDQQSEQFAKLQNEKHQYIVECIKQMVMYKQQTSQKHKRGKEQKEFARNEDRNQYFHCSVLIIRLSQFCQSLNKLSNTALNNLSPYVVQLFVQTISKITKDMVFDVLDSMKIQTQKQFSLIINSYGLFNSISGNLIDASYWYQLLIEQKIDQEMIFEKLKKNE